jgi:hypothetical protein
MVWHWNPFTNPRVIHQELQCRTVERDEAAIELMRMSIRIDECAVEAPRQVTKSSLGLEG